ncbi:MAG: NAD(P)-dependent alcohol dehydrogenase [Pseudomonadota bacterium]
MITRIVIAIVIILCVSIGALGILLSHTSDCPALPQAELSDDKMMAVLRPCYGSPDVLEYVFIDVPEPAEDEVLVKVAAASVNPLDYHFMRGSPYIMRLMLGTGAPDNARFGRDFAGTVVATGSEVTRFAPGDRVFGGTDGAFGEYITRPETGSIAPIPEGVGFEDAAAIPIAGVTALQALRDHGQLEPGQRVLINGASGGVGTYAVQMAKAMGAHVTAVCSGRNVELVRSIGADEVINYKEESYLDSGQPFDLIVDMVGNHSPMENQSILTPEGKLVIVGGDKGNWIAPFVVPIQALVSNQFVDQELKSFTAVMDSDDLVAVANMVADGEVVTVVDSQYPLSDTAQAMRRSESRRARGKIIIEVEEAD